MSSTTTTSSYEDVSGDGGVLKKMIQRGKSDASAPQKGHIVFAHYTGKLESGKVFDSSRGKPHRVMGFYFQLGNDEVIKGWDVGIGSMRVGECASFKIRADYAYGLEGIPGMIPPKASLLFDIELLDAKRMSKKERADLDRKVSQLRMARR